MLGQYLLYASATIYTLLYSVSKLPYEIAVQPGAKSPDFDEPIRSLRFGKINFLHTTDTHGWYLGHIYQKQYSADWGDFISFHKRLKEHIEEDGGDLLLVDSGDRHDGNGLSDLTFPNGLYSSEAFISADYDIVTLGNHELYVESVSTLEYNMVVPVYGERFISTNVEYLDDNNEWVPFGNTHRYFESKVNKYKILSFSFIFDFKWFNRRVNVIPISEILHQQWFINLVDDYAQNYEVDMLLIVGHIPVTHDWYELYYLHHFLRKRFPQTVIQYFGGHSHIRDFSVIDRYASGLQSGRYCETVGFLSLQNLDTTGNYNIVKEVDRKYIDFNIHSFTNHTNYTDLDLFHTDAGKLMSKRLRDFAEKLGLNKVYGYVPHNYFISAADYTNHDPKSLLRFLENDILSQLEPKSCSDNEAFHDSDNIRLILINTGGIRYDLYKGEFTKNALFTVSPFKNKWRVIPNVPTELAIRLKDILNDGDFIWNHVSLKNPEQYALAKKLQSQDAQSSPQGNHNKRHMSYGYKTYDDLGSDGDDTIHRPLPNYYVPNVIQSYKPLNVGDGKFTDVVYYDFIEPFVPYALQQACNDDPALYEELASNTTMYNDCADEWNLGQLLKRFVEREWS